MNQKIKIYATYDPKFNTWNAMTMENECLFYGSIDELENWIEENKALYIEEK